MHINDDLLTCFITNGASIQDLVDGNAVGNRGAVVGHLQLAPVLLGPGARHGPVDRQEVVADRRLPAGVHHRPEPDAPPTTRPGTISALNGLSADSSGIREVKVILFDESALPEFAPTVGGEADYTGSGPKASSSSSDGADHHIHTNHRSTTS